LSSGNQTPKQQAIKVCRWNWLFGRLCDEKFKWQ